MYTFLYLTILSSISWLFFTSTHSFSFLLTQIFRTIWIWTSETKRNEIRVQGTEQTFQFHDSSPKKYVSLWRKIDSLANPLQFYWNTRGEKTSSSEPPISTPLADDQERPVFHEETSVARHHCPLAKTTFTCATCYPREGSSDWWRASSGRSDR